MKNKKIYSVVELEKKDWEGNKYIIVDNLGKQASISFATIEEAQKRCNEFNSTYYLSDYSNDEILDFFNSIYFKPLLDKINSLIGLELTYDISIKKNKFGTYSCFKIKNKENLVDNFPILALAWKEFKVSTFNADICCDKKTGELKIWCTIDFSYRYCGGGTNGAIILTAWYRNGEWIMQPEKERCDSQD